MAACAGVVLAAVAARRRVRNHPMSLETAMKPPPIDHQLTRRVLSCVVLVLLAALSMPPSTAHAREIVAEGEYLMGDGETMSAAQERARVNAVQKAAEEAGAYVRSYTKTRDMVVEEDVIEMVADHAMKITVISSKREMAGDAVRFTVRIKAEFSDSEIETNLNRAAQKLDAAEAYQSLKAEFDRQAAELAALKRQLAAAPESSRKAVLEKIGRNERRFKAGLAVDEGTRQLAAGNLSGAEESFSKAIELDPAMAEAYAGRAESRLFHASTEELMRDADRAVSLQPDNARVYAARARVTLHRNCSKQHQEGCAAAFADLNRAAQLDPKSPIYPILLGEMHAGLDQYDKAVAQYERAVTLVPAVTMPLVAVNTYLHSADFHLIEGRPGYLQRALADLDRAVAIITAPPYFTEDTEKYARLLRERPTSEQEVVKRLKEVYGVDLHALNDKEKEALGRRFQQAEKVLNNAAQVYWKRAGVRYEAGDTAGAEQDRTAACSSVQDPDGGIVDHLTLQVIDSDFCAPGRAYRPFASPNALAAFQSLKLGERAYGKMRKESALRHLSRAIERDPHLTAAYVKRGQTHQYVDPPDLERAIADYSAALAIDPKDCQALSERGKLYFYLGRDRLRGNDPAKANRFLASAESDLNRLLALSDADLKTAYDRYLKTDARVERARLYRFTERFAAAADDFGAAAGETENFGYFLDQAKALESAGDRAGAVRAIDAYLDAARASLENNGGEDRALAEDIAKAEAKKKVLAGSGG